jgi:glycosyltransferase involved in cell wall biosynthesis
LALATILYFSKDYSPHDHRFLAALAGTEHRVCYLRLERSPRQTEGRPVPYRIEEIQWAGGRRPARLADGPRLLRDLRRVLREVKPDLIHVGPIQTCGLLAALTGFRPQLVMSWGFDLMQDAERNAAWRGATRYVLRRAAFFTSDCEATREKAVAFGVPPERTVVFPWGVDLEHFKPRSGSTGEREHGFTLFCNRSWEPRYGVDVLARAFVSAARQRPDLQLMLLGGGSQGALIHQILQRGGAGERVTFAGQVSQADLPRYYAMADLFISPSHIDGSSVSLMEALACGLPCLVSDIPANREWVTGDLNGWLFPDGDADALAAAILQAYDGRRAFAKIGRAARATAEEKADWTKNFQKLLAAYEKTLLLGSGG